MRRPSLSAVFVPFLLADSAFSLPVSAEYARDLAAQSPPHIEAREPWSQNHFTPTPEKREDSESQRRWVLESQQTVHDTVQPQSFKEGDEGSEGELETQETSQAATPVEPSFGRRWVVGSTSPQPVSDDQPAVRRRWTLSKVFEDHLNPNNLDGTNDVDVIKRSVESRSVLLNMLRPVRQARRRSLIDDRMTDGSKLTPGSDPDLSS